MGDEWEKLQEIRINGLRAQVAERDALIAQVTKILGGYPDSDLLSLATTVAAGYERWCDGHDAQVEALRAQLAKRDEKIAELQAQVAERDALIAQFRADIANRDEELARLNSVFSVM